MAVVFFSAYGVSMPVVIPETLLCPGLPMVMIPLPLQEIPGLLGPAQPFPAATTEGLSCYSL